MTHPLRLYGDGLRDARTRGVAAAEAKVRLTDGSVIELALDRYLGPADETDEQILEALRGPVLDVGCGPGRHLHALARRGVFALGVDLSPIAVELARGRGGQAIVGSIFDDLPGAGTWRSALLLDGNIGIGGEPERLLARLKTLLAPDGDVLVELEPPGTRTRSTLARIETADDKSAWFRWARVAVEDIDRVASAAGFQPAGETCTHTDRWFTRLTTAPVTAPVTPPPPGTA
jgi:SAM-dependent methyltransferase